jgi:hypothetical protein
MGVHSNITVMSAGSLTPAHESLSCGTLRVGGGRVEVVLAFSGLTLEHNRTHPMMPHPNESRRT